VTDNAIICSAPVEEARFWFYALSSLDLNNYRAGSGQPLLNQSILKQIAFLVPPDHERIEIGKLLGALDDKIELNRRTNETLEALARAIFNDWFVDFGPTRAKAEGRPPYLAQELWDLFPDALDDDDKPEGWEYQKLQTLADVNWGDTKTTKKSYTEEGYTAFSASGPDGLLPYHDFERVGVVLSAIGANCGVTWLARGKWSCIKNTIRFWSTLGTRLAPPVRKAHIGLGVRSRASAEEVRADLCVVGG
jgi:type I restriction enzyme S subunit